MPGNATERLTHAWLGDTDQRSGWGTVDVLAEEMEVRGEFVIYVEVVEAWSVREEIVLLLSAGELTDGLYYREGVGEAWQQGKVGVGVKSKGFGRLTY